MSRDLAVHTCHCTSHGLRILLKNWLTEVPSFFRSRGGKFSTLTQEYNQAIRPCIMENQFPCGRYSCSRLACIMQKRETVRLYAEFAKRKEYLVLLVGVKDDFMFGYMTSAKMQPIEYVICPYASACPEIMQKLIKEGKCRPEPVSATCFSFSLRSIQNTHTVYKNHYNTHGPHGIIVVYRTHPIPTDVDLSRSTMRRGQDPPAVDKDSLQQALANLNLGGNAQVPAPGPPREPKPEQPESSQPGAGITSTPVHPAPREPGAVGRELMDENMGLGRYDADSEHPNIKHPQVLGSRIPA